MAATTTIRPTSTTNKHYHHRRRRRNEFGCLAGGSGAGTYTRLWRLFSIAAFRRRIIKSIRCGGGIPDDDDEDDYFLEDIQPTKPKPPISNPLPPPSIASESGTLSTGKLSDLLNLPSSSTDSFSWLADPIRESTANVGRVEEEVVVKDEEVEVKRKVERFDEMSKAVNLLQKEDGDDDDGGSSNKGNGAKLVRKLAKEDSEARCTLAMLGAISPLVGMLEVDEDGDGDDDELRIEALYALLNLGIGNDLNKAAIVQAGAVHKMLNLIKTSKTSTSPLSQAVVANFLALTALDTNKPIIGTSGAIPFLVKTLKQQTSTPHSQAKQDALRALYNLSIHQPNLPIILSTDLIPHLITTLTDMEVSDRNLSILSNIVTTSEGRKAISSSVSDSFNALIDVLNWVDSPNCQEKASYILMVMAHKSYRDRQTMVESGIASALLELTLIGTTLAQKRASKILDILRLDKGKRVMDFGGGGGLGLTLSAPICGGGSGGDGQPSSSSTTSNSLLQEINKQEEADEEEMAMMSEENKAVKQLVQQSLQNNMRKIVRRANLLPQEEEFVPSEHLKSLTSSSTSKSLPF